MTKQEYIQLMIEIAANEPMDADAERLLLSEWRKVVLGL